MSEKDAETQKTTSDTNSDLQKTSDEIDREKSPEEIREEEILRDDMQLGGSPEGKATNEAFLRYFVIVYNSNGAYSGCGQIENVWGAQSARTDYENF